MDYYFQLAGDLLYALDKIVHTIAYITPVVKPWLEQEMGPPWVIDPTTHRTMSRCSTVELHLAPSLVDARTVKIRAIGGKNVLSMSLNKYIFVVDWSHLEASTDLVKIKEEKKCFIY